MIKNDSWKREQHLAVRNSVGWYDWTHRLLEVTGPDATAFLEGLFPKSIHTMGMGRAKYTTMLNDDAIIIDDVVIFRFEENKYWVSTLFTAKLVAWFDAHKAGKDVSYRVITKEVRMIAVQGPKAKALVNAIASEPVDELKYFQIKDNHIGDIPVQIGRSSYTGEYGFEIYFAAEQQSVVEAVLEEKGKAFDAMKITEFEVIVLSLPTEKGYCLMSDLGWTNPYEVGLANGIDWNKEFVGKEALKEIKAAGPERILLGFTVENDNAHIYSKDKGGPGGEIYKEGKLVGRVTKFAYGYYVEKSIGFALVDAHACKVGDRVTINDNEAVLTERCWYDPENKKVLGK